MCMHILRVKACSMTINFIRYTELPNRSQQALIPHCDKRPFTMLMITTEDYALLVRNYPTDHNTRASQIIILINTND